MRAGRPVPDWVVGTALLAPAVLVGGWLAAGALQPASYSPMRQTMSVLAGQAGTDRWVMTAALVLVGSCQIATGAGLAGVRVPARILLVLTGLSTLGIAASPEPATGPTPRHLAFAVGCVVTTAAWPALAARRVPARPRVLSVRGCVAATVVFAGLSCWLLIAARDGGGDLGLAERLTSAVQALFPLVVALALRCAARDAGSQRQRRQELSGTGGQSAGRPTGGSWRQTRLRAQARPAPAGGTVLRRRFAEKQANRPRTGGSRHRGARPRGVPARPGRVPPSELRRVLARAGGPTFADAN